MSSWRRRLSQGHLRRSIPPRPIPRVREGMMVTPNVRLDSLIGEGAMGAVWKATHLGLRTTVAVKFISEELSRRDEEVASRFRHEASTAAQIKSQHVVQTFDHGVTPEGVPYIVMEYLDGESLGDRLERTRWLSVRQTGQVVTQTAKALNAAHRLGIVHRDIKPDNIFLASTADGLLIKVLDFGIAKHDQSGQEKLTNPGILIGTPEFMSPEQILTPSRVDHQADSWALAVVAYLCLTGELPFTGDGATDLCMKILNSRFVPPRSRRPEIITPELDTWFARSFHRKLSERFGSAKEAALAFVRAIPPGHEDLEDELMVTGEHPVPPSIRPPTVVGVGGKPPPPSGRAVLGPGQGRSLSDMPTRPRGLAPLVAIPAPESPAVEATAPSSAARGDFAAGSPAGPRETSGPRAAESAAARQPASAPAATSEPSSAAMAGILDPATLDGVHEGTPQRISPKLVVGLASAFGVLVLGVALGVMLAGSSGPAPASSAPGEGPAATGDGSAAVGSTEAPAAHSTADAASEASARASSEPTAEPDSASTEPTARSGRAGPKATPSDTAATPPDAPKPKATSGAAPRPTRTRDPGF